MKRLMLLLMIALTSAAAAQPTRETTSMRFEALERSNAWLESVNGAGVRCDTVTASWAALYVTKSQGGRLTPSSSDNSWNAGVETRSIRHFDCVSFAGGFSYDYFDGRNMCGSMFTLPGYYPVDIMEFTPGRKVRETYAFDGAVAAQFARNWTVGAKVDFAARNYAKRKDLRHKNTRLDFEFAPSVMWRSGRWALGVAYVVGVDREKLEAEEVGASATSYDAFFNRGLYYGSLAQWKSNDMHLTTAGVSGFPLKETTQGVALQAGYGPLLLDATWRHRQGESGERDITWHNFTTDDLDVHLAATFGTAVRRHLLRAGVNWTQQRNREQLVVMETVNGISTPHFYGSTLVYQRRNATMSLAYEYISPRLDLEVSVAHARRGEQSTLMYPEVHEQQLRYTDVAVRAIFSLGRWQLLTAADFRAGGYNESMSHLEWLTTSDYPTRLTEWYYTDCDLLTADRMGFELGVRRLLGRRFYVDLTGRCIDICRPGQRLFTQATLSVGYNF